MLLVCSIVKVKPSVKVITIETALWFFFCSNKEFSNCSTIEPSVDLNPFEFESHRKLT
jgi:hypothetical protein